MHKLNIDSVVCQVVHALYRKLKGVMPYRIHYQDDIYLLSLKTKTLANALKLDFDPELFIEQVRGEIAFIAATIARLYQSIKSSSLIIGKAEILKDLQRLCSRFAGMLESILDGDVANAVSLSPFFDEYRETSENLRLNVEEIKDVLNGMTSRETDTRYTISEEEYRCLFAGED